MYKTAFAIYLIHITFCGKNIDFIDQWPFMIPLLLFVNIFRAQLFIQKTVHKTGDL